MISNLIMVCYHQNTVRRTLELTILFLFDRLLMIMIRIMMMIIIIIIIRKGKIEKRQTRYMLNFKMKSRRIYLSFYILKSF